MNLQQAVFSYLTTPATPLAALVGTRIYHNRVPQDPKLPCIRYFRASGSEEYSHSGQADWPGVRYQFDCLAASAADAHRVAEAVRESFDSFPSPGLMGGASGLRVDEVTVNGPIDGWDDDLDLAVVSIDVEIQHAR